MNLGVYTRFGEKSNVSATVIGTMKTFWWRLRHCHIDASYSNVLLRYVYTVSSAVTTDNYMFLLKPKPIFNYKRAVSYQQIGNIS